MERVQTLCPYCRAVIRSENEALTCSGCRTAHHVRCWTEHGCCSVFGCSGLTVAESFRVPGPSKRRAIASFCLILPVYTLVYTHNLLEDLMWRTPSIPLDAIRLGERFFLGTVLVVPPIALLGNLLTRWNQSKHSTLIGGAGLSAWGVVLSAMATWWSLLVLLMALS